MSVPRRSEERRRRRHFGKHSYFRRLGDRQGERRNEFAKRNGPRCGDQRAIQLLTSFSGSPQENLPSLLEFIVASRWGLANALSPEAHRLATEHAKLASDAIRFLANTSTMSASEGYARLQSAGAGGSAYDQLVSSLFAEIRADGVYNREYLILAAASALYWMADQDLSSSGNPWLPVLELFHAGYNCGFEESEDDQHVSFLLTFGGQGQHYPIV